MNRQKTIIRTSVLGVAANVALAGFKAAVGLITNSIAVTLDAVNNLSDALSSVITIIGAKLGAKKPDKKPALNPELWERLLELTETHEIRCHWVKGHADNEYNERCDALAVAAREREARIC